MRDNLSESVIREAITCVQQSETDVISQLCIILETVSISGETACLSQVSSIMKKWSDCPPSVIAEELESLVEED